MRVFRVSVCSEGSTEGGGVCSMLFAGSWRIEFVAMMSCMCLCRVLFVGGIGRLFKILEKASPGVFFKDLGRGFGFKR